MEDIKVNQGMDSSWLGAHRMSIYDHEEINQEKKDGFSQKQQ